MHTALVFADLSRARCFVTRINMSRYPLQVLAVHPSHPPPVLCVWRLFCVFCVSGLFREKNQCPYTVVVRNKSQKDNFAQLLVDGQKVSASTPCNHGAAEYHMSRERPFVLPINKQKQNPKQPTLFFLFFFHLLIG